MSDLFRSVIEYTCDDILQCAPYLAGELHAISFLAEPGSLIPRTDGASVYWDPDALCAEFFKNESLPVCRLLHMLAHILLGHIVSNRNADAAQSLAFDVIAVRFVHSIDPDAVPDDAFIYFSALEKLLAPIADPVRMAEKIRKSLPAESIGHYAAFLQADDHTCWRSLSPDSFIVPLRGDLGDLRGAGYDNGEKGSNSQAALLDITLSSTVRTEFTGALDRYTEPGELPETDHDAFDVPLYLYSNEIIGGSILEDTEFREGRKLRSFVIAIDTSGSCVRGLTQQFLEVTRDILSDRHMFFNRFHLCILQCDDRIRDEAIITTPAEFDEYIRNLRVYGGGGTDFRPVFDRIDALVENGELPGLRGMLYFSDGKGIFPNSARSYDVTFAFPEGSDLIDVPVWVRRVGFRAFEP